jgi:hypothetical protein
MSKYTNVLVAKEEDLGNTVSSGEVLQSEKSSSRVFNLPITLRSISVTAYTGAIIIQIAITIILILVSRYDIVFPTTDEAADEPITNDVRTGYTAAITLLATLLSTFSVGQIKQLWLNRNISRSKDVTVSARQFNVVLIGLGNIPEQVRQWKVSLVLLLGGLGTTALVTGLTPTIINCG